MSFKAQVDRMRAEHRAFTTTEQDLRRQRLDTVDGEEKLIEVLLLLVCFLGGGAAILALKQAGIHLGKRLPESGTPQDADQDRKEGHAGPAFKGNWKDWARTAALTIGLPLIAVLLSIPLRSYNPYPFVLFYAAVSLVAWSGGLWWGFLSLVLSLSLADFFLIVPYGTFTKGFNGALGLVLCASIQLLICWLIDTQKRSANALRDQAGLLDLSHDCIMVRELDGRVRFWNHGAEEIYGFSAQEACGRITHELLQTVFSQPLAEIETHVRQHGSWEGELQHVTRNGAHIVVNSRWVLQKMGNGAAPRMMEVNQDITEHSFQEKALRKSAALLEQTGRLAGFGGWDVDIATSTVMWAPQTYRILGADPSFRPTLQQALDMYTPESRPVIAAAIEKASASGEGWDLEASLIGVDGRHIWARVIGTVEFAGGRPVRLAGVFQDISSRVAERQELQDANTRTVLATESCGIGIWDWQLRSGKFNCDALIYQLFGLKPECDKTSDLAFWAGRVHADDRAGVEQALKDGIEGIRPYDCEFRTVWDDGNIHHIKATGKVIRDQNGLALRMVGTNMDITARKQAEEALRLSNEHEQRLIMGIKDYAIVMLDPEGRVTTWNEGAEKTKGYPAEEIVGSNFSKFYTPEAVAEGKPAQELKKAAEEGSFEVEAWRVRKDGSRFWASMVLTALFDTNGKLRGFAKVTRDISERKAVEAEREKVAAELARYTRALERSNQELDAFAYAASHDLKAPLRVIHNASMWIEEDLAGNLTTEVRDNMNLLRSRVRRMDRLLDDLLEYSRIGRVSDTGHTEAISGTALMENIVGLLSPPESFVVAASPALAGIEVYRMPLQQILINLITNAIKHHDKKTGRIDVSVEDLGAKFRFSVKDDGPGIPPEYHEQIFKMFQTLKPRDQVEGSGMGLAMVRKHVDIAGGELELESAVGKGSTFSFTWPKQNVTKGNTKQKFTRIGETS
jgi:PAS domain S-box-containing protein